MTTTTQHQKKLQPWLFSLALLHNPRKQKSSSQTQEQPKLQEMLQRDITLMTGGMLYLTTGSSQYPALFYFVFSLYFAIKNPKQLETFASVLNCHHQFTSTVCELLQMDKAKLFYGLNLLQAGKNLYSYFLSISPPENKAEDASQLQPSKPVL